MEENMYAKIDRCYKITWYTDYCEDCNFKDYCNGKGENDE